MASLLDEIISSRPFVFDGAMGTMLASLGGAAACNEELCISNPRIVAEVHRAYFEAGSDAVTTNTFGASRVVLADHGLADRVREINLAAVAIARDEAGRVKGRKCLVAGELGPTSKLPTLGHISFEELFSAYVEQTTALLDGGVDMFVIATCQDALQAKAAAAAVRTVQAQRDLDLPILISMTIEQVGTMLLGTELQAALAAVAPYRPAAFGINCATGPEAMEEHIAALAEDSAFPIICRPNAGMPQNVGGRPVYPLSPDDFGKTLAEYTRRFGISIVGGCCGTTPAHIAALVKQLRPATPAKQARRKRPDMVSSLYTAVSLDQEPKPFIIAEQTNVNGSKKFRELLLADDFDAMAEVGRKAADGAHALDVCVAYAGRSEADDMAELVRRLTLKADVALMIDSTSPVAIESALSRIAGRSIINSINLEDGGAKASKALALAARYGAAVVALAIDEQGMARTADAKFAVAKRLVNIAAESGLDARDLLVDPLTFTLASGDPSLKTAAIETLNAITVIKREIPGVRTLLGVSNISYGLPPHGRQMLTSVFLNRAIEAGLDAAIINPLRVTPLDRIHPDAVKLCMRLIDDDDSEGDPLAMFLEYISGEQTQEDSTEWIEPATPAEAVRSRVIEGSREMLSELVSALLEEMSPSDAINKVLLPSMQEVGQRFGAGRMPLPFVLQSAEVMRAAIDLISPHMKAHERVHRATIVLATVRGDVHDIGKNLVEAILANNGFRVINLGIRQPASAIIEAARAQKADAIGLSGLLVSSTEVMREDLALFREAGLSVPVLCGGAALTQNFVDEVLARAYGGDVSYCADAFAGLSEMERIAKKYSPPL